MPKMSIPEKWLSGQSNYHTIRFEVSNGGGRSSLVRIPPPNYESVEEFNTHYHDDDHEPSGIKELKKARDDEYYNNFIIRSC